MLKGATNYNSLATIPDNMSCTVPGGSTAAVKGCMIKGASNYNSAATIQGPCSYSQSGQVVRGCTDNNFPNYNSKANVDDGSCRISGDSGVITRPDPVQGGNEVGPECWAGNNWCDKSDLPPSCYDASGNILFGKPECNQSSFNPGGVDPGGVDPVYWATGDDSYTQKICYGARDLPPGYKLSSNKETSSIDITSPEGVVWTMNYWCDNQPVCWFSHTGEAGVIITDGMLLEFGIDDVWLSIDEIVCDGDKERILDDLVNFLYDLKDVFDGVPDFVNTLTMGQFNRVENIFNLLRAAILFGRGSFDASLSSMIDVLPDVANKLQDELNKMGLGVDLTNLDSRLNTKQKQIVFDVVEVALMGAGMAPVPQIKVVVMLVDAAIKIGQKRWDAAFYSFVTMGVGGFLGNVSQAIIKKLGPKVISFLAKWPKAQGWAQKIFDKISQ